MKNLGIFLLLLAQASSVLADNLKFEPGVRWSGDTNHELVDFSKAFLVDPALPEALTQIRYRHRIHVGVDRVTQRIQSLWYYPNASDVQDSGNEIIAFNQVSEQLTLHSALSVSGRGETRQFDPQTIRIIDPDRYNTFSDVKQAVLAIPGVERGGVTILEYEIELDKSKLEAFWSRIIYPHSSFEYRNYEIVVTHDPAVHLNHHYDGDVLDCSNSVSGFSCSAELIPALKSDPSVYWRDVINQLTITEGKNSWTDIAAFMQSKFNTAMAHASGIDALFSRLTGDKPALDDKISAIHDFVSRDIRYNSMSEQGHALTPHNIEDTAKNRYGDCKDKSALLTALLKKLGLNPVPVLVATDRKRTGQLTIPSLAYFNHVIVCNDSEDKPFCIDATDTTTDWRSVSGWIQGSAALSLANSTAPSHITENPFRWRLVSNTEIRFDKRGGQTERNSREYIGEYAGSMRSILEVKSKVEKQQWAEQEYQQVVNDTVRPKFEFSGIDRIQPSLTLKSETNYEPFLDPTDDVFYVEYDSWLRNEISSLEVKNVHYGYDFPGLNVESQYRFDLEDIWKLSFPGQTLALKHEYGTLERRITSKNPSGLTVKSVLKIPGRYIEPDEIEAFNRFLSKLKEQAKIQFLATKT
ncbi:MULTISPECIES: transglutaminase domain-containing protein [unclassified Microbulbifer]|uniref:DUF3857 domain-containing protein n=1 Tax=unclassified Microbulbifer TaxID=2619833 RepID=UPI0027E3C7D5|nr:MULTISPECIES: transglutaminase domain-containing protein [unclassified Microbulbifer]